MKKSLTLLSLFLLITSSTFAQNFNISSSGQWDTTNLCSGTLHDPGGPTLQYTNYNSGYFVINPPGNGQVSLVFSQFNLQTWGDYVYLYDGVGTGGTYLGSYNGSNLPNSGNAILSTSDAITIQFSSNYTGTDAGFTVNWSTNATTVPNAAFTVSNNNPAFNSAVSFSNTSTAGAISEWHFGDGNTSTEDNPVYSYTTAGTFSSYLVSSNCVGSDTSIFQSITVMAAPTFSVTPDSLYTSVVCGNTITASFDITHLSGGTMNYNIEAKEQGVNPFVLEEDFEGSLGGFTLDPFAGSSFSATAVSGAAADGTGSLSLSGFTNTYDGVVSSFASSQPIEVSYYVKPTNTSNQGYIAIGNSPATTYSNMFYSYSSWGQIRVFTWFGSYYFNINNDQWNLIELRNIDWVTSTYDIYINGTLGQAGLSFNDINITDVNEVHLFNSNNLACGFDKIRVRTVASVPITAVPATGVLSTSNTNTISLSGSTANKIAGRYIYNIEVATNAAGADSLYTVPWVVDVTGVATMALDKTCFNFGSVYQSLSYQDSVRIINSGCDSLHISSILSSSTDITPSYTSLSIQPWDTAYLKIDFIPSSISTVTDTLYLTTNDVDTAICLSAISTGAPQASTDSLAYTRTFVGCADSVPFNFEIINNGQSTLNWNIVNNQVAAQFDDFENGFNSGLWASHGTNLILAACATQSGTMGLGMTGNNRYAVTNSFNLIAGDSVRFWAQPGFNGGIACENPDGSEHLYFEYSTNGFTWLNLGTVFSTTFAGQMYRYAVPVTGSIQFRFRQVSWSGTTIDNYVVDDFSIGSVSSGNFNPNVGNLVSSDTVAVSGYFDVAGLGSGTYQKTVIIQSNDPVDSMYTFNVTINIIGVPNIYSPDLCVALDSAVLGYSSLDSVLILNNGCDDLNISSYSTGTAEFSSPTSPSTLMPGDSTFVHILFSPTGTVIGARGDTLSIASNDTTLKICLTSYAKGAPLASIDTTAINVTINSCNDSVLVQRTLVNSGLGGLTYQVGGSGSNPTLQEVLDTFSGGHSAMTAHIPNIYNFFNGVFGSSISDGGGDMYDGGNYISTDLGINIPYSHDLVTASTSFGTTGEYFTYKGTGMWLLAADLDGVDNFRITGNLGADGSGSVSATILNYQKGSKSYKGFVKRVYSAGDPSINHLIIVEDEPGITRTNLFTTSVENHNIFGLTNSTRIYYLLYAGASGSFINDNATQSIMNEFIDMISASGGLEDWITVVPDSGQVAVNDSVTLDIWIKSGGLTTGTHTSKVTINTNDLANPTLDIPVTLTVNGLASVIADTVNCLSFNNVLQGSTELDTLWLYNDGCDTLDVTSISNTLSEFSVMNTVPFALAPADSFALVVEFTPITVGSFLDTLRIFNNDRDLSICLNATSLGAPLISLAGDSLVVEVNKCRIIQTEQYTIDNIGQGSLDYSLKIGEYQNTSNISYNTSGATTNHTFRNIPTDADTIEIMIIHNGDFGFTSQRTNLYINSGYYSTVYDQNYTSQNDTIIFTLFGFNATNYTTNDSITIGLVNSFNVTALPNSFHQVNIRVVKNANWVAVTGASSGVLAANGSSTHNLLFNSAGLGVGRYQTVLQIANNQANEPYIHIPIVMNVISEEEIILSDTCVNFPNTFIGDTSIERLVVYNTGCEPLNVSSIINTNPLFKLSSTSGTIAVDDSLEILVEFAPTIPGNYSASLIINNSDTTQIVCINGVAIAKPLAGFLPFEDNVCMGKFIFQDTSVYAPTSWFWRFGDGNTSTSPNPTHFYQKPGYYEVWLRVVNANGFDTIAQTVLSQRFFADFVVSHDTVYGDSLVTFGDSSYVGSQWLWNFGDGGADTLQHPTHVYTQSGTYTISFSVSDTNGCSETLTKVIVVLSNIGLNENSIGQWLLDVYPNPSEGLFTIDINERGASWINDLEIVISDMSGRQLKKLSDLDDMRTVIDLGDYESGVYLMQVYKQGELLSSKRLVLDK